MSLDFSKLSSLFTGDITKVTATDTSVVGVDIGASSIKVVQIKDNRGVATLETYGELQLGPYGNVEIGRTTNLPVQKLVEAFVDILRESSATGKNISLAISFNSSFSTIISIPTKQIDQIDTMIPVEARKYVPVPLSEVTLDWFPVSATSGQSATKVLLAAIHNDALTKYRSVIKSANLTERYLEIEIFSTLRSVIDQDDTVVAVIDVGASSTKVYIAQSGVVGQTHSLRMNGVELTNAIASSLGVHFKEAEELKRAYGLHGIPNDSRMQKALTVSVERGLREAHTLIARYTETEGHAVEKVILTGGGASLKGLDTFAKDMLSIPTVLADPFDKVAYPAFLEDTLTGAGPTFSVAIGAALRAHSSK